MYRGALRPCVLGLILASMSALSAAAQTMAAVRPADRWTANDDMLVFFQAVQAIEDHALQPRDGAGIIRESLRRYVETLDAYSHYLEPSEYAAFQAALHDQYAGVGMELCLRADGRFDCVPYPDSPAARAGIREGDILVSVDGWDPSGWSLQQITSRIRGAPGAQVELGILQDDRRRTIEVTRETVHAPSVVPTTLGPVPILRIYTFRDETAEELAQRILALPADVPIVLDARGNPGGDPYDAADAANLFLNQDTVLLRIRKRSGEDPVLARRAPRFPDRPLMILQDGRTASAAEVFLAALVVNRRALSVGRQTFGKGLTQRILPLLDGSAIVLTDGELLPPTGETYDGRGLPPSLQAEGPDDDACLDVLRRLPALQAWLEAPDGAAAPGHGQ